MAMAEKSLNERQVAELLGLSVQTVRNWRFRRVGPAYIKLGGAVRYRPEDIEKYLETRRISF
jgi:predicted DNA-binding transcriptional regulator AlpA